MIDPNWQADRDIARHLGRTWPAFFQRFGRLTAVQRSAIPPILSGASVLVASATASGKTEAACAPLLERSLNRARPSTILYVSPTRALVNDLHERLAGPCTALSVRLARRTGEHKTPLTNIPHVLITTPESLDSLLCRGRTTDGHALAHASSVLLDEIHLLDGTARGEHVRWLLERLRRVRQQASHNRWTDDASLQVIALSATIATPELVRDRFLPGGTCVIVPGHREIEVVPATPSANDVITAVTSHMRAEPADRKIIVFCNARRRVDDLTRTLRDAAGDLDCRVHAHHGSLAQRTRETAEEDLKSDGRVIVVATSTLEIGIDVGDIDLIVLDGPAPDVPALLQRIGRGNRRTGTTRVMAWANSAVERLVHDAMLAAARAGDVGAKESGPHYGVVRQQLASYVFQSRRQRRRKATLESLCTAMNLDSAGSSILRRMLQNAELETVADEIGLGLTLRDAATTGDIHSTIERAAGNLVVDATGAGVIASGVKYQGGDHLGVGGQDLRVERIRDGQVEVRRTNEGTDHSGQWSYVSSPWFQGAGQPQALRASLGFSAHEWPCLKRGTMHFVFHFGGNRRRALLQLLDNPRLETVNEWFAITHEPIDLVQRALNSGPPRGSLRSKVAERLPQFEYVLGRPHSNGNLPEDVRIDEVVGWLAIEQEMAEWARASLVRVLKPEVEYALGLVAAQLKS